MSSEVDAAWETVKTSVVDLVNKARQEGLDEEAIIKSLETLLQTAIEFIRCDSGSEESAPRAVEEPEPTPRAEKALVVLSQDDSVSKTTLRHMKRSSAAPSVPAEQEPAPSNTRPAEAEIGKSATSEPQDSGFSGTEQPEKPNTEIPATNPDEQSSTSTKASTPAEASTVLSVKESSVESGDVQSTSVFLMELVQRAFEASDLPQAGGSSGSKTSGRKLVSIQEETEDEGRNKRKRNVRLAKKITVSKLATKSSKSVPTTPLERKRAALAKEDAELAAAEKALFGDSPRTESNPRKRRRTLHGGKRVTRRKRDDDMIISMVKPSQKEDFAESLTGSTQTQCDALFRWVEFTGSLGSIIQLCSLFNSKDLGEFNIRPILDPLKRPSTKDLIRRIDQMDSGKPQIRISKRFHLALLYSDFLEYKKVAIAGQKLLKSGESTLTDVRIRQSWIISHYPSLFGPVASAGEQPDPAQAEKATKIDNQWAYHLKRGGRWWHIANMYGKEILALLPLVAPGGEHMFEHTLPRAIFEKFCEQLKVYIPHLNRHLAIARVLLEGFKKDESLENCVQGIQWDEELYGEHAKRVEEYIHLNAMA